MNKTVFYKICTLFRFALILLLCTGAVSAFAQSQNFVTINLKNVPIERIMRELEGQTKYVFLNKDADVKQIVSIDVKDKPVPEVLAALFSPRNIAFEIESRHIVISRLRESDAPLIVEGRILDSSKKPIIGAAVTIKGTTIGTSSGIDGRYTLQIPPPHHRLC